MLMNIFVIMPFDRDFDEVYSDQIKGPLELAGYSVSRADDPASDRVVHQNIYDQIIQNLWDADYIIADLSNFKPNIVYELGIAHTLNKKTIQISQRLEERIPFDIKSQNVILYRKDQVGGNELPNSLLNVLRLSTQSKYVFSNIVDDFVNRSARKIITVPPARA